MKQKDSSAQSAFLIPRLILGLAFCGVAIFLAVAALKPHLPEPASDLRRYMPTFGQDLSDESRDLNRLEQFWNDRLTYPTGIFNPAWVRAAAIQHRLLPAALPAGNFTRLSSPQRLSALKGLAGASVPLSLSTSAFTPLGPSPEIMTGCTGCF